MLQQIISDVPLFVWILFVGLLLSGLRASKTGYVPLAILIIVPSFFFSWSLFGLFNKYGTAHHLILFWFLCLALGIFIGFSHMQTLNLHFDKQKKSVQLPGSWIPLFLSLSIFSSKFFINTVERSFPYLSESALLFGIELFATVILGIFLGRGTACFKRYRAMRD